MRLVLGGINGTYLRDFIELASGKTDSVSAAVAYASDATLLFDWCLENKIPLKFWGRFDHSVPVSLHILKGFLDRKSANYVCKLVEHLHAKVIWWRGVGAYIGSANFSQKAWYNNIEAGCFFDEEELSVGGMNLELEHLFSEVDKHASPLTLELYSAIEARAKELSALAERDADARKRFLSLPSVQHWSGFGYVSKKGASDRRKEEFLKEWFSTLQTIRDIGKKVSEEKNRPKWIQSDVPIGSQADQFLHAHYYQRTFDGRRADYERHFNETKENPDKAVEDAIEWWRDLPAAPNLEDTMLNDTAPFLREKLSEESLRGLDRSEFSQVCRRIYSIRDHGRRISNKTLRLPENVNYTMEEKLPVLSDYLFDQRTSNGSSILDTLQFVLYGGARGEVPTRLWEAITDHKWRIEHLGVSALGEIVGWALPDDFPPRNGRTSKALRSLGYDVRVHVS